jgi:hypothetical protein
MHASESMVKGHACWHEQEIDPNPENQRLGTGDEEGSFLADLAGSIPGIDEAMSFAEVMRQVRAVHALLRLCLLAESCGACMAHRCAHKPACALQRKHTDPTNMHSMPCFLTGEVHGLRLHRV